MTEPAPNQTQESRQSLWRMIASPTIWAAHFLLSNVTAAIWCEKFAGRDGPLCGARVAIAIYTVVALIGIALNGWGGWRRHSFGAAEVPHDDDTPEDRHRFLGSATVLLAALSAIAVLFAALVIVFFKDCR